MHRVTKKLEKNAKKYAEFETRLVLAVLPFTYNSKKNPVISVKNLKKVYVTISYSVAQLTKAGQVNKLFEHVKLS